MSTQVNSSVFFRKIRGHLLYGPRAQKPPPTSTYASKGGQYPSHIGALAAEHGGPVDTHSHRPSEKTHVSPGAKHKPSHNGAVASPENRCSLRGNVVVVVGLVVVVSGVKLSFSEGTYSANEPDTSSKACVNSQN
jgi:hypothetical protein